MKDVREEERVVNRAKCIAVNARWKNEAHGRRGSKIREDAPWEYPAGYTTQRDLLRSVSCEQFVSPAAVCSARHGDCLPRLSALGCEACRSSYGTFFASTNPRENYHRM